jgi:hypothetical protein
MLKIIAGGAVAALMMVAAPGAGVAAETGKSPAATQEHAKQATEFSDQRRRRYVRRYYRPYYYPYAYYPRSYYRPYYGSYGYYGYPYYRRPGIYFGFGF